MFSYDLIAEVYARAFAATQGVSPRHNEAIRDRHRSRLNNRKSKHRRSSSSSQKEYVPGEPFAPRPEPELFDDAPAQHDTRSTEQDHIHTHNLSTSDDENDDLNEEQICNNNNDLNYNLNKLSQSRSSLIGTPVEAFPPSLIKWPLNNNIKSKRIANIRKQVKHLSTIIKMTIDSDLEPQALEGKGNPAPFSSLVDMARLQSSSSLSASQHHLPTSDHLDALLKAGRLKEAKSMVRLSDWGINHPVRKDLWKKMVQNISHEEFSDFYYWETVQQIYGSKKISECHIVLPTFVDHHHMVTHGLSTDGMKACERVISVIAYNYPAITCAPLVYSLTATLMHYMEEPDVYSCITVLVSQSSTFISQTKILNESMWRTVEILARKHVHGSYAMLGKYGISSDQINEGFKNWTWWMFSHLPVSHLFRILDCFLLEGSKVLLRCSLAIFHLFMKQTSRDSNMATTLTTKGMAEAMALFCKNISVSPSKLLKTAFGIRAFSKNEIKKIVTQTESVVKSDPCMGGTSGAGSLFRSTSLEGLPTSKSQEQIQTVSNTLDIKELLQIWNWIPMRMTMHRPNLVYTTQEHGSSLTSFYQRVSDYEPTLLLIRTTKDEIFGAYCSAAWNQRNQRDEYGHKQTYFGTGETFLFTLKPKATRFEWVGITKQRQNVELSSVAHQSELFMHADNDMVTVGGGGGHGLMLDHDLQCGKTETCETFNNPPLCSTPDFEIKVVEVFVLGEINQST